MRNTKEYGVQGRMLGKWLKSARFLLIRLRILRISASFMGFKVLQSVFLIRKPFFKDLL